MDKNTKVHEYLSARFSDEGYNNRMLITRNNVRPIKMHASDGTGEPLVAKDGFGADVIRFPAQGGVDTHTHEGAHILFVLAGHGIVEYGDERHPLEPGLCYLIPSMQPHAIRATTDLVLIAVGNDHRPVGSKERLDPVE